MTTDPSLTCRGPSLTRRGAAALFAASMVFGAAACGDDDAVDLDVDEEQLEEDIDEGADEVEDQIDEGAEEGDEG